MSPHNIDTLKIDTAIILAAGKGTRFNSKLPKVLHKLCGRTMLERSIRAVSNFVEGEIIVVAGFGISELREELKEINKKLPELNIKVVEQKEQKGTGHAVLVTLDSIPESSKSVLILPGDCPLIEPEVISEFLNEKPKASVSFLTFDADEPFGFGRIIRASSSFLYKIVEEKDCSSDERKIKEVNSGIIYCEREALFNYVPKLENNNAQGEYYITDLPELMKKDSLKVSLHKTSKPRLVYGANTRLQLYELEKIKRKEINDALMLKGVTFENPETSYVDEGVEIASDVYIGSNTRIYGTSSISSGCIFEGDSLIRNSIVGSNCEVRLGSYIDSAKIEENVVLGPFCHIRPGSQLSNDVKIGNFVETKNAKLSKGVKANHLTYLGDIEVGENTNVGAGTIVCNYDGKNKHKSLIGKNSFIGSNSTLISPIEIKDEAYVGAGSVINKNVPNGALAIARTKQQNIEGWSEKKKSK